MAIPFTDKQVREVIAGMIETAVGVGPKVYPYNCLNYKLDKDGKPDFSEWPGLFTYGDDGEYIHGWVIKRVGLDTELRAAGCEDFVWSYEVSGFYLFNPTVIEDPPGTFTSSDDAFSVHVAAVVNQFTQNPLLTVNSVGVQHFGLQFPVLTVLRAGQKLLHFAGGNLEIEYQT